MRKHPLGRVAPGLACLAALAAAQEADRDPLALVWEECALVAQLDGPAVLRERVTGTSLEVLFAPALWKVARFVLAGDPRLAKFESWLAKPAIEQLTTLLAKAGGRVTIALEFEAAGVAGVLAWTGKESDTSLAALAAFVEQELVRGESAPTRLRAGGLELAAVALGAKGTTRVTLPVRVGPHWVSWLGADLEKVVEKSLQRRAFDRDTWRTLATSPAAFRLDVPRLVPLLEADMPQQQPDERARVLQALGIAQLRGIDGRFDVHGKRVTFDLSIGVAGDDRGVFGAFFYPAVSRPSPALAWVPRDDHAFTAWPLDGRSLARNAVTLLAADWGRPDLAASVDRFLRVDLEDDVLAHLGNAWFGSRSGPRPPREASPQEKAEAADGSWFGFELANGKAFAQSFDRLVRARGLHVARKRSQHQGIDVFSLPFLGLMTLHYAVTDEAFVVGVNDDGLLRVRWVLDGLRARRDGQPPPELTADVRALLALAPDGWQGLAVSRASILDEMLPALRSVLAATEDPAERKDMAEMIAMLEDLQRLLAKHDAGTDLVVLRSHADGALIRCIW